MGRRACPRASAGTPRLPLLAADLPARMAPQPPPQQPPQLRTLRARWMIGRPLLFSWRAADAGMTASARIPLARPLPRTSTWWASGPSSEQVGHVGRPVARARGPQAVGRAASAGGPLPPRARDVDPARNLGKKRRQQRGSSPSIQVARVARTTRRNCWAWARSRGSGGVLLMDAWCGLGDGAAAAPRRAAPALGRACWPARAGWLTQSGSGTPRRLAGPQLQPKARRAAWELCVRGVLAATELRSCRRRLCSDAAEARPEKLWLCRVSDTAKSPLAAARADRTGLVCLRGGAPASQHRLPLPGGGLRRCWAVRQPCARGSLLRSTPCRAPRGTAGRQHRTAAARPPVLAHSQDGRRCGGAGVLGPAARQQPDRSRDRRGGDG